MKKFSAFVLRHAGIIALLGTLLGFVGAYYSVQLYKNLRTNIEELLPTTARSVIDLNEVTTRLEAIDNLAVLIYTDHPEQSKRFVLDLVAKLQKLPRSLASSVEYRIDKELKFFRSRAALYMELHDLIRIRDYIHDRIDYERQLYNPLNIFSEENIPEPRLDFLGMQGKYSKRTSSYDRFPGGFYATPDGKKRVVLVYLNGKTADVDQVNRLKNAVVKAVEELNPKSYAPDMEIKWTGGVQDTLEEQTALIADLELSTVVVTLLVALAMILFFRNFRATFALLGSLFIGTFWTFGLSYFVVGYLNANSAFLGSIVIGNGINFGIILLARYLEERRGRHGNSRASATAITQTATATWTAALAAGLSYGSLILTGFRGFRQFGIIGLMGMVLCWISAYTLMPAYLTLLERWKPLVPRNAKPPKSYLAGAVAQFVSKYPRSIWLAAFGLTVVSLGTFAGYSPAILETDLSRLRNKWSIEHGSAFLSHDLDEIFQRYLSPMVILPKTRPQAQQIAEVLKKKKEEEGPSSLIASVQTLDDFIPADQPEKIRVLHDIQRLLPPQILQRLSASDQKRIADLLNPAAFHPIGMKDLPQLVLNKFTEKDGSIGKMVLVEPPLGNVTWDGRKLVDFVDSLRSAGDAIAPGTPVAGTTPIAADMFAAVSHDGPWATLFALLAVVLLVVLLFRNLQTISLVLFALFIGVIWLAGMILGFGWKVNFLNFIALPITFGIGVDYGVNIFQRYRQEGGASILTIIRNTGGAVGLCSFTTVVGYCSLLIAGNQGFVSFGRLAVAGEVTCVLAAVVALPAFLMIRQKASTQKVKAELITGNG